MKIDTSPDESEYYNTTRETGKTLNDNKVAASKQDEAMLTFFKNNALFEWTPCDVATKTGVILTSARRSINTLTKQGKLIKTDRKRKGVYGRMAYLWTLK